MPCLGGSVGSIFARAFSHSPGSDPLDTLGAVRLRGSVLWLGFVGPLSFQSLVHRYTIYWISLFPRREGTHDKEAKGRRAAGGTSAHVHGAREHGPRDD